MNKDGEIYLRDDGEIPLEDKARLEGYLRGRADEVALKKSQELFENFEKFKNEVE